MKVKRVALLFKGELREHDISFQFHSRELEKFKERGSEVDIFYAGWDAQREHAYEEGTKPVTVDYVRSLFEGIGGNVIDVKLLTQKLVGGLFVDTIEAQMFLSEQVNRLKRKYAWENSIDYDVCFLLRPDVIFQPDYITEVCEHLENMEVFPRWLGLQPVRQEISTFGGYYQHDLHFIGDDKGMNAFCNGYDYYFRNSPRPSNGIRHGLMGEYLLERRIFTPDSLLGIQRNRDHIVRHGMDMAGWEELGMEERWEKVAQYEHEYFEKTLLEH